MSSSKKYPYPPQGRSLATPRGLGLKTKAKIFKKNLWGLTAISKRSGGIQTKKTYHERGMELLWNNRILFGLSKKNPHNKHIYIINHYADKCLRIFFKPYLDYCNYLITGKEINRTA